MIPLAVFLVLSQPSAQPPEPVFQVLAAGYGSGSVTKGLETIGADTLMAFPTASYNDSMLDLQFTGRMDFLADSSEGFLSSVSAGAFFRYPGSPWISAGVFRGLSDPYIPGLNAPISEWGSRGVLQKNGFQTRAGGVLGFQGFWNQYADTLSWYGIRSPWMGFGMGEWNVLEGDSARTESYSAFLRFRRFRPWFTAVSVEDHWSYMLQIRGLRSQSSGLNIQVVPGARFETDSTEFSLTVLATGIRRAVSGHFTASAHPDKPGDPFLSAGAAITSQAGVDWSALAEREKNGDFGGYLQGHLRSFPAGCGGRLSFADNDAFLTATAFYSPVRGVSSVLSVTSRLKPSSPEPSCVLAVTGADSRGSAVMKIEWTGEETLMSLGVSAWIK